MDSHCTGMLLDSHCTDSVEQSHNNLFKVIIRELKPSIFSFLFFFLSDIAFNVHISTKINAE